MTTGKVTGTVAAPASARTITGQAARRGTKINIATPAYGGTYSGAYVRSLYRLLATAPAHGLSFSFSDIDYADIVVARNYLLSNFYYNMKDCSHMLFIDDDMGFSESLVYGMVQLHQDVVGAISPKRQIDLKKLHSLGDLPFDKAYAMACDFIGSADISRREGGFVEVEGCGTGIMLVSRRCIDRMVAALPHIVDRKRFRKLPFATKFQEFLVPFDKIVLDDRELSEDFSFCHRWRKECGGKIYASVDNSIQHVGSITIDAAYSQRG